MKNLNYVHGETVNYTVEVGDIFNGKTVSEVISQPQHTYLVCGDYTYILNTIGYWFCHEGKTKEFMD